MIGTVLIIIVIKICDCALSAQSLETSTDGIKYVRNFSFVQDL